MNRTLFRFVVAAGLLAPLAASTAGIAREAASAQAPARERFIVLEGGRNFRDVGGYRTADGRTVRWGALYRSGSLAYLTPKGIADFDKLDVAAIGHAKPRHCLGIRLARRLSKGQARCPIIAFAIIAFAIIIAGKNDNKPK